MKRIIGAQTQTSAMLVEWCVGVDEWAAANVRRGAFFRSILVDVMYWPCGDPRDDG
ncbi:hypothetical protein [Mycoplana dimorpha]|uniref:hypothetical protein n=1 Tax=Mycoplana dimorpha TaxID=28320 RepID=UPI00147411D8|nr:hypothetical protein [Mycoplana dimorpha]